jgi:hypothetical protein
LESGGTLGIATYLPLSFGFTNNGIRKEEFKLSYCLRLENWPIMGLAPGARARSVHSPACAFA